MPKMSQGLPVSGYRPQSADAVWLVNMNKQLEEMVLRHLDALKERDDVDGRWLAIGRTAIEQGFMAANRAVFQPERVNLAEDFKPGEAFAREWPEE
ncbi:Acb2/Tad1 domain-containing protein [Acidimangrovimonas sediminis]|uniref:Acb2/Tad1 domain-containing protein n=1 Tax=Acidimangrovimonas sediminis TaxID=2056283 RepID=UPI000C80937D|nr:cyclic nucleotide-binding protein [Acidimangrovimonas sediminis]